MKRLAWNLPPNMQWPFYSAPGNELSPVLCVEALNPPERFRLDVTKVHAVFEVVHNVPPANAIAASNHTAVRP